MTYHIGQIVEGTITGIQPYGAFVSLDNETQGLIHVSEVQSGYTKNINELLKVGEKIRVQIIDIDEYSRKISLSRRTLEETYVGHRPHRKRYFTNRHKKIGFASIEEQLPHWIEEALENLGKRNGNVKK